MNVAHFVALNVRTDPRIREDRRLTQTHMELVALIHTLQLRSPDQLVNHSNAKLAELMGLKTKTIDARLVELRRLKWIKSEGCPRQLYVNFPRSK